MKRKICLLCAAVIFALALPAFRASAEAYDPMAWQEGVTIYLEAISFEGPHIGVPVPSGNRWLSTKRKAIPADGFAEAAGKMIGTLRALLNRCGLEKQCAELREEDYPKLVRMIDADSINYSPSRTLSDREITTLLDRIRKGDLL